MIKTDKNIRSSYKLYKKNTSKAVTLEEYIFLCNNFHKFFIKEVEKGNAVSIPERLGTFSMIGSKAVVKFKENGKPNLAPNWIKTKELWERCPECREKKQMVYFTNEHTSGVRYKLLWSKKRVLIKNKSLYAFRLTRENKRLFSASIKKGKEYFIKKL